MKVFSKRQPSDTIKELVPESGSLVVDCQQCGRIHYYDDSPDMEPGELDDLERKRAVNPDKYICHSDGYVSWGTVDGKQTVINCPCHFLRAFEDTIWAHRELISAYLMARAQADLDAARETATAAKTARAAVVKTI